MHACPAARRALLALLVHAHAPAPARLCPIARPRHTARLCLLALLCPWRMGPPVPHETLCHMEDLLQYTSKTDEIFGTHACNICV